MYDLSYFELAMMVSAIVVWVGDKSGSDGNCEAGGDCGCGGYGFVDVNNDGIILSFSYILK